MIFIDLENAYDNIPRENLVKAVKIPNIHKPFLNLAELIQNQYMLKKGFKIAE